MRKFWTGVARFIALIFAIAFVITAVIALVLVNIDRSLLSPVTYKSALAAQQVYERLPRIIAEQLVTSINYNPCLANPLMCEGASPEFISCAKAALGEARYTALTSSATQFTGIDKKLIQTCLDQFGSDLQSQQAGQNQAGGPPPFLRSLDVEKLETIISSLIPPDDMQAMAEDTLTQAFAYLNGQQDTAAISLVNLKQRISSQAGLDVILEIIRAQPPCTIELVEQMIASFINGQPNILPCNPPETVLTFMTSTIQTQLRVYASQIPNRIVILSTSEGQNPANRGPLGSGPRGGIRLARLIMRFSPVVPLLFLLLISLLVVRALRSWLRWWGIPFFIAGLLALGLAISASAFFERAWLVFVANRIPPYLSLDAVALAHDLLRAILQPFLAGLTISVILVGVPGLGMWVGSTFIKQKSEPEPGSASLPPEF
jgi:hypothetical protein